MHKGQTLLSIRWILSLVTLAVLGAAPGVAQEPSPERTFVAGAPATTALCSVCRVHEGETEEEPIHASEEFRGEMFPFCSEGCRTRFLETPEAYLPPVFPRPSPAFVVRDLENRELSAKDLEGGITLIDFWATWCLPCVTDLPKLTALHQRYKDRGFRVVGISIDDGEKRSKKVERMIRKKKVKHPIYLDQATGSAWEAYLVRAIPAQFLVDPEGSIVAQWSGVIDLEVVEAAIQDLLETSS